MIQLAKIKEKQKTLGTVSEDAKKQRQQLIDYIVAKFGIKYQRLNVPFLAHYEQVQMVADYFYREFWFNRFSASFNATFLPNLRPMHRVLLPNKRLSYYTKSVTHKMFSSWTTSFQGIAGKPDDGKIPDDPNMSPVYTKAHKDPKTGKMIPASTIPGNPIPAFNPTSGDFGIRTTMSWDFPLGGIQVEDRDPRHNKSPIQNIPGREAGNP